MKLLTVKPMSNLAPIKWQDVEKLLEEKQNRLSHQSTPSSATTSTVRDKWETNGISS
jgi:hypothetical protein